MALRRRHVSVEFVNGTFRDDQFREPQIEVIARERRAIELESMRFVAMPCIACMCR